MSSGGNKQDTSRRTVLGQAGIVGALSFGGVNLVTGRAANETKSTPFRVHRWQRDKRNPILPPGDNDFDRYRCMNPFVVTREDRGEYWLFYSGADAKRRQRICLATCPIDDGSNWTRHGSLFDVGGKGDFDESWCVLPCVHRIGDTWHMYYTLATGRPGKELQVNRAKQSVIAHSYDGIEWFDRYWHRAGRADWVAENARSGLVSGSCANRMAHSI